MFVERGARRGVGSIEPTLKLARLLVKTHYAPICADLGTTVLPDVTFHLQQETYEVYEPKEYRYEHYVDSYLPYQPAEAPAPRQLGLY